MLPQKEGMFRLGGVSRGLNCVYLRPAPVGSEVLLRAEVEAVGKRMGGFFFFSATVVTGVGWEELEAGRLQR